MSPKLGMAPLRREQIVRATIRCLAREGYTRLTMKKVAREAGVSQGILHYYFADKRAMLVATLTAVSRDLDRRVAAAQSRARRDPAGRERALAYFESKASLSPAAVAEQIVAAFDSLEGVLAEVEAGRATVRAAAGEWSAQEVLDHLVETFRPGVDELRCVLAGQRPPGKPIPAALQSKAPTLRPWRWLRDEVHRPKRDVPALVHGVRP